MLVTWEKYPLHHKRYIFLYISDQLATFAFDLVFFRHWSSRKSCGIPNFFRDRFTESHFPRKASQLLSFIRFPMYYRIIWFQSFLLQKKSAFFKKGVTASNLALKVFFDFCKLCFGLAKFVKFCRQHLILTSCSGRILFLMYHEKSLESRSFSQTTSVYEKTRSNANVAS